MPANRLRCCRSAIAALLLCTTTGTAQSQNQLADRSRKRSIRRSGTQRPSGAIVPR